MRRVLVAASVLAILPLHGGMGESRDRFVAVQILVHHIHVWEYLVAYLDAALNLATGHQLVGSGPESLRRSPSLNNVSLAHGSSMARSASTCSLSDARQAAEMELRQLDFLTRLHALRQNHPHTAQAIVPTIRHTK